MLGAVSLNSSIQQNIHWEPTVWGDGVGILLDATLKAVVLKL